MGHGRGPSYPPGTMSSPAAPVDDPPGAAGAGETFAEGWHREPPGSAAARARADEVGLLPLAPLIGATLRLLAVITAARTVAELGTGTGGSALWLLSGMRPDGVLTSVDSEGEHHRQARAALAEAEVAPGRTRLITGQAQEVLPRLAEGTYDLVHVDLPPATALDLLPEALRVLRPGGVLAVSRVLVGGRVADGAARDADAVAARGLTRALREDDTLTPLLLPLGDGLLVVARA